MASFYIRTYGCQMNVRDSEVMANRMLSAGYRPAETEAAADIVIINSCSVREKAEDKALGKAGLLCSRRELRPNLIVGLTGCMAQRLGRDVFRKVPGLAFSVGTRAEHLVPEIVARALAGEPEICETGLLDDSDASHADEHPELFGRSADGCRPVSGFVTVLLGCDRRCAYCIVPDVRGHERSRDPRAILDEVRALTAAGIADITLLGQSVMNYGRLGFEWPTDILSPAGYTEPFPRLLEFLSRGVPDLARLRFTSGHPSGITDELIRAMRDIPQVCPHLHLPVQSGSDRILKRMRRGYDSKGYLSAVSKLRAAIPDIAVTTDIIVGFPGETEEDFNATRRLMDEAGFENSFIFKYSPRPGTPSSLVEDDVTKAEKTRRNKVLLEDQDRRGAAINSKLVGTETEVLVEGPSLRNKRRWTGRNGQNKIVIFDPWDGISPGEVVRLTVTEGRPQTLFAVRGNASGGAG